MKQSTVREDLRRTEIKPFEVGGATFGDGRLTIIAGPCVVESREHALMIARECQRRTRDAGLDFVFKASYDKANRSSHASYRGPGVSEGLEALRAIKEETGLPVLTDVHDVSQVEEAAAIADVLQIPAFLCRQTDLIVAACRTAGPSTSRRASSSRPGTRATSSRRRAPPRAKNFYSPSAASRSAITTSSLTCARSRSCAVSARPSSST